MNKEQQRLQQNGWKKWGSYVSDRQWGTVREDYSADGNSWDYTTHDMARSKAWRWGEDGIAGISDEKQLLCFSLGLWNGKDPILKERFFGLTNAQGNHGEDVKELYYYLDATPTHSYMKMLYKYPQREYPYQRLIDENARRSKQEEEFELLDTGIFNDDKYFDVVVEYAKAGPDDILISITAHNRGHEAADLHLLPTIWFRNTWVWGRHPYKPALWAEGDKAVRISHEKIDIQYLYQEGEGDIFYCENETNNRRLYNVDSNTLYPKDGINDYLLHDANTINPEKKGTKAAVHYNFFVPAKSLATVRLRLTNKKSDAPFADFDSIFQTRLAEADEFYNDLQTTITSTDEKMVQRQALAGMLWNKQFYSYKVQQWMDGDPAGPPPPPERLNGRNKNWKQLNNEDIISVPDKWEFPWYAAWDLAFHCVTLAMVDPDFAKQQLRLLTEEWYMNPSGEFPAYEWAFGDVNPPVHAGATYRVFKQDAAITGRKDYEFLETVFHKLMINFTWWVNRKDSSGSNIFEGGFLGLDNVGAFDRSMPLPSGIRQEQADATSWMAIYALNMLHIALELASYNKVYTGMATKFFEHFLYIAGAMASMGDVENGLWDDKDEFYYDQIRTADNKVERLRLRSMVGLIPLFAVEVISTETLKNNPAFEKRMSWFLRHRPDLAQLVSRWNEEGQGNKHLLSLLRGHRMKRLLSRMLDETEFLSEYGVRSLSKQYEHDPFVFCKDGVELRVNYLPGESDSYTYGGNSNWRGPVWMQMNFLMIESLRKFHYFYSDDFRIEYPTRSGEYYSLKEVGTKLAERLLKIFLKDENGRRAVFGANEKLQTDPYFNDLIQFHEYFHGDNGKGLGAAHQTGWTGLVANLIKMKNNP
ncbi:Glycosyl hydrolase family 63 C-terminal domain-containing protein [Chitinophaga sp. YR627]|uniref:MGH1-like glycoside hydrolase domain-containing protein n=1 Tax=Chitinophaga sp. YR627 TaxID=1881041 RepID=UPI0008F3CB30|nr:glucosidase [Chitinophaga sp. YR627]SFO57873.1 Glycosyl hydrolase family 63 C-terminal domain-containing protein [Chitinophaga sp. YR627]